jgi:hypothetical protein
MDGLGAAWVRDLLADVDGGIDMPEKRTMKRARKAAREGKAPSTVAGEFVREEIEHVRRGKHGARSPKQAIAIGLSKARRAGVRLPPPGRRSGASQSTREQARRDLRRGKRPRPVSAKRSTAAKGALRREGREAASSRALAYQARSASRRRKASGAKTKSTRSARASAAKPTTGRKNQKRKGRRTR